MVFAKLHRIARATTAHVASTAIPAGPPNWVNHVAKLVLNGVRIEMAVSRAGRSNPATPSPSPTASADQLLVRQVIPEDASKQSVRSVNL